MLPDDDPGCSQNRGDHLSWRGGIAEGGFCFFFFSGRATITQ